MNARPAARERAAPRRRAARRPQDTWTDARPAAPAGAAVGGGHRSPPPDVAAGTTDTTAGRRFTGPLLPAARTPLGRLLTALLGWPPLGLGVAAAIGEETGCGRFAASCAELNAPGTWIVQAAIFVLLLAVAVVARWSAHGTVATLVVGVPSAIVLSAGGGSREPEASSATLAVLLLVAYVLGVGYALLVPLVQRRGEPGIGD